MTTDSDEKNRAFIWATHFMRSCLRTGIRQIVISPGSRSTPLTLAAAALPELNKHVALDERSAGFIALGIGKTEGTPALLICTSGTAAANYYPAVIESRQSGTPLMLATADRPPQLRSVGTSQAIDQIKMFGDYPVFFHEAGEPVLETDDLKRLERAAAQGIAFAMKRKGPAHLNFAFRKPLEPTPEMMNRTLDENNHPEAIVGSAVKSLYSADPHTLPAEVQQLINGSERPLVIAGPQNPFEGSSMVSKLAQKISAPLIADPGSGLDRSLKIKGFDGFLRKKSVRDTLKPDLIIRFGLQPVGKIFDRYLAECSDIPQIHFADTEEWQDARYTMTHRLEGRNWSLSGLRPVSNQSWIGRWRAYEQEFLQQKRTLLENEASLTDGHLFDHLTPAIPTHWNLFLSNSFPIRDAVLFGNIDNHRIFTNRGASGIDGFLSTAIGATLESGNPGVLFTGDLGFLHDVNALLSSNLLKHPLVVVLINNNGGTIFRMLPIFQQQQFYRAYFETPQDVNFEMLCSGYKVSCHKISSVKELKKINFDRYSNTPGLTVLECITEPEASMRIRKQLWEE